MSESNTVWWVGKVLSDFHVIAGASIELLTTRGEAAEQAIREIQTIIEELNSERLLNVTFIGQYSAGKSTIVSALTGDKGIKIDADIATDCVAAYDWNGILLNDTPGLYTERIDHDEQTKQAIQAADLLVFVLTSDLFDDITVTNFKQLAYEEGFGHKMFLVVNKMSMEAGTYRKLTFHYTQSLKDALQPYDMDAFPICFIDAADFIEGQDDEDDNLISSSHFSDFVDQLNTFVSDRGLYGKLDSPLRRLKSELEKAMVPENENKEYFQVLERLEDRIRRSMQHLERTVQTHTANLRHSVVEQGNRLVAAIGSGEYESAKAQVEKEVAQAVEDTVTSIENLILEAITELQSQLDGVLQSDVAKAVFEASGEVKYEGELKEGFDVGTVKSVYDPIATMTDSFSKTILKLAGKPTNGLFKATTAAGTDLHKTVFKVGKMLGHNFKPWEAANIAKGLGNFAKFAGPALSVFGAGLQAWQIYSEHKKSEQLITAKRECANYFAAQGGKLQGQLTQQFSSFRSEFFVPMLDAISQLRRAAADHDSENSEANQRLGSYCSELDALLALVSKGSELSVS